MSLSVTITLSRHSSLVHEEKLQKSLVLSHLSGFAYADSSAKHNFFPAFTGLSLALEFSSNVGS